MAHNVRNYSNKKTAGNATEVGSIEIGSYDGAAQQGYLFLDVPRNVTNDDIGNVITRLSDARNELNPELERRLSFQYGSRKPSEVPDREQIAIQFKFQDAGRNNEAENLKTLNAIVLKAGLGAFPKETDWVTQTRAQAENVSGYSAAVKF